MVFGVVSLVIWALIVIVTLKYVVLILRMDNNGEGGTLTLMALVQRVMGHNMMLVSVLGMIGAALFYGDAIITPALSVLSAVEGLKLSTPVLEPFVLPVSLAILVGALRRTEPRDGGCCGVVRPDHACVVPGHGVAASRISPTSEHPRRHYPAYGINFLPITASLACSPSERCSSP